MRDAGHRTPDIGQRTAKKAKIIYPPPRGVDIINYTMCPRIGQIQHISHEILSTYSYVSSTNYFTNICNESKYVTESQVYDLVNYLIHYKYKNSQPQQARTPARRYS